MSGIKIRIPKFTGQETDVSDKARDWFTGLQTCFTKNGMPVSGRGDVGSSVGRWCPTRSQTGRI